jgi:cytochrome c oxidase subunit II
MALPKRAKSQRVLIASSHPLFGQGLRSLLEARQRSVEVIGIVSSIEEAMQTLEKHRPDLVVVDYDDQLLNREEALARFFEGERKLRVVLLSLSDPQHAQVYDRRTLAAAQIDDWLEEWPVVGPDEVFKAPQSNRRSNMKHFIVVGILVVLVTALLLFGLQQAHLLPTAAALQANPIDRMFGLEFSVIAFLFALIVVFMVYSIVVFRRKKGDTSDARHIEGNQRLEIVWTAIPLATVLGFAYLGSQALAETTRIDPGALQINVIGSQWSWRFEYPDLGIQTNELRMPVDKQALLRLSSTDVIHSFWVPEFRVKQDALPGGKTFVRDLRVTPDKIGKYTLRCAELCGLKHTYMEAPVIVMASTDFDAWAAKEAGLSADPLERAQKWYQTFGCKACHTQDGSTSVGPTWKGVYGSQVKLADGSTVTADDAYIIESIRNPGAKIVEGYQNIMPAGIGSTLTDQQIQDLVALMKSLK